jgi:hypothetical protein
VGSTGLNKALALLMEAVPQRNDRGRTQ